MFLNVASADRFWHYSKVPARLAYVGYRGKTGKHLLAVSFTGFDPIRTSAALANG